MKKILLMLSLSLIVGLAMATGITRTSFIKTGYTMLYKPFACTTLDTITASETYTITIDNRQKYAQNQQFYFDLTDVSGTNTVVITAYGKVTPSGGWVQIGTPITWTSDSNDGYITSTSPFNYNYLKVTLVADAVEQKNLLAAFEVKTSNSFEVAQTSGSVVISGDLTLGALGGSETTPALTIISDADSDAADTNESLKIVLTPNATPTLATWGFTSTQSAGYKFDKNVTFNGGATLGDGDDLIGSATSDITINTTAFTVAGATGDVSIGNDLAVGGDITFQNGEVLNNVVDKNFISTGNFIVQCPSPTAINSTDNITAAQMLGGVITSTSGAATALTTPTATAIMALIPGGGRGTTFDLIIDNSAGSSTITLTLDASISVNTPAITGGDVLTVSTTNTVALFRFYFVSATAAKVFRIH